MGPFKIITASILFATWLTIMASAGCTGGPNANGNGGNGDNNPTDTAALSDVVDQSINNATVDMVGDILSLTTIGSPASPIGAFVGGGRGNKAMASLPDYHRFALSQLQKISFEVKNVSTSGYMYMNLIVDLDCALNESTTATIADLRANRKILVINTFFQVPQDNDYVEYAITKDDAHWLAVGAAGGLPANEPGATLGTFLTAYPNACIINGVSADGGLGRELGAGCQTGTALATTAPGYCGKSTNGMLFILGDSNTLTQNQWNIRKITVNNTAYSGL